MCSEGQTIVHVLSSMLCYKKIQVLKQEKSSLKQEKSSLLAEKEEIKAGIQAGKDASILEINASIREINASIREKDASIRESEINAGISSGYVDQSLCNMDIYSATGMALKLTTKLDKLLIDESCRMTPIAITEKGELCTFHHNGGGDTSHTEMPTLSQGCDNLVTTLL